MAERVDIGTFIAAYLRTLGPAPVDAGNLARVVDDAFFTIPRSEIIDGDHEYAVPRELVEDAACMEGHHAHVLTTAITQTLSNGLLVVEMPTRHEVPRRQYDPPDMVRFKLTARARKISTKADQ